MRTRVAEVIPSGERACHKNASKLHRALRQVMVTLVRSRIMFSAWKQRDERAIQVSSDHLAGYINGLKISWLGNAKASTAILSDVLFDSYVKGFLFSIVNLNIYFARNETHLSRKEKIPILEEVFCRGFGLQKKEIRYWWKELLSDISGNGDFEFQRGVLYGILLVSFARDPSIDFEEVEIKMLLGEARQQSDPLGWLVSKVWFEELERMRPALPEVNEA